MKLGLTIPFAAALTLSGMAGAFAQAPQQAQAQGAPPCFNEFIPLRTEVEKRGAAIKAASKRKASAEEVCPLFKRFYEAETKLVNYMTSNGTWCGIPEAAIKQQKANHEQTAKVRNRVCSAGAAAGRPHTPTLGEALGANVVPDRTTARTGRGTYDTLTGNPLGR